MSNQSFSTAAIFQARGAKRLMPQPRRIAIGTFLALTVVAGAQAQLTPLVTGAVAERVGRDLISEARAAASSLIAQGEASGNALVIAAGNQLQVQADNVTRVAGKEASQRVKEMSAPVIPLMQNLFDLTSNPNALLGGVSDLKNATVLDLRALTRAVPGIGENFYVQRLRGSIQLERSQQDFPFAIQGTGLGVATDRIRSNVRLIIDGKAVQDAVGTSTDSHTRRFSVKNEELAPKFSKTKVITLDGEYLVTQETFKGWFIKSWEKSGTYRVPFKIALVPASMGTLTVVTEVPHRDFVRVRSETLTRTSGDHNCARCENPPTVPYNITYSVPGTPSSVPKLGDFKLAGASMTCLSGACGWSRLTSVGTTANQTTATGAFLVWGSPVTYAMTLDVLEYKALGDTIRSTLPSKALQYGQTVSVAVPSSEGLHATAAIVTKTGATLSFALGTNDDQGLVTLIQTIPGPDYISYVYRVNPPKELDL